MNPAYLFFLGGWGGTVGYAQRISYNGMHSTPQICFQRRFSTNKAAFNKVGFVQSK